MLTLTYFDARIIRCDNGETAALLYYLTGETFGGAVGYGAEVIMHGGCERQSAAVRNVTDSPVHMAAILERLCSNTVTPCVFPEVLEEELNRISIYSTYT